jgi:8-amino-7-oxononanoate synthase
MNNLELYFATQLASREELGTLRSLRIASPNLIDFTSNDYLGLARSQELKSKITELTNAEPLKNGATGSRLLSGNSMIYEELENDLQRIFKAEACLLFNSGYNANFGVLSSIAARKDTILYDELSHASIKDGVRSSFAQKHSFKHNDLDDLKKKIIRSTGKIFIVVESIYSMDGDLCPLQDVVTLAEQYQCFVVLDEAHSTGVMGTDGAGLAVSLGLHNQIAIRIYTFGKAIGVHSACVAGSKNLKNYLVNFSRPFIYTTALPDHTLIAIREAFQHLRANTSLQKTLADKIQRFGSALGQPIHKSAIQTIKLGSIEATRKMSEKLLNEGFDVRPIFSPTVQAGSERLRICLHTFNTDEEIDNLAKYLRSE